jgi:hypothetical protein
VVQLRGLVTGSWEHVEIHGISEHSGNFLDLKYQFHIE